MKLPGDPLKSFDCFAWTCHVALPGVAVQAAVFAKFTVTLTDWPPLNPEAPGERTSRMPEPSTVAVHPVRDTLVAGPEASATPGGGRKFAEPSVCDACGAFVSVNVKFVVLPDV
jgi:hypothetical protein